MPFLKLEAKYVQGPPPTGLQTPQGIRMHIIEIIAYPFPMVRATWQFSLQEEPILLELGACSPWLRQVSSLGHRWHTCNQPSCGVEAKQIGRDETACVAYMLQFNAIHSLISPRRLDLNGTSCFGGCFCLRWIVTLYNLTHIVGSVEASVQQDLPLSLQVIYYVIVALWLTSLIRVLCTRPVCSTVLCFSKIESIE